MCAQNESFCLLTLAGRHDYTVGGSEVTGEGLTVLVCGVVRLVPHGHRKVIGRELHGHVHRDVGCHPAGVLRVPVQPRMHVRPVALAKRSSWLVLGFERQSTV